MVHCLFVAFLFQTAVKAFELDPLFVDETVNFIKKELKKPAPDMAKVSDAMKRTAAARRKSVESMNLAEFLGTYPALTLKEQVTFVVPSNFSGFNFRYKLHVF